MRAESFQSRSTKVGEHSRRQQGTHTNEISCKAPPRRRTTLGPSSSRLDATMRSSRAVWEAPAVPSSIAQLLGEGNSGPVDTMVMAQRLHSYKGLAQVLVGGRVVVERRRATPPGQQQNLPLSPNCHRSLHPQEPYFKSKHTAASAKARPGDAAEMVQLRKKAAAMGRDFQSLLTAHERQETAGMGLRQQVGSQSLGC